MESLPRTFRNNHTVTEQVGKQSPGLPWLWEHLGGLHQNMIDRFGVKSQKALVPLGGQEVSTIKLGTYGLELT